MKNFQKTLGVLLGSLASLCVLNQFEARGAGLYTSEGQFIGEITGAGVPYYQNTFGDLNGTAGSSVTYSNYFNTTGNGVSYTITAATGDLEYVSPGGQPSIRSQDGSDLTITFNAVGDAVLPNAVGGNFFLTGGLGGLAGGSVSLLLSDGTTGLFNSPSFRGYVSTGVFRGGLDILSLTISAPGGNYPTLNDIIVAVEVPEPSVLALTGIGAAALLLFRRKK